MQKEKLSESLRLLVQNARLSGTYEESAKNLLVAWHAKLLSGIPLGSTQELKSVIQQGGWFLDQSSGSYIEKVHGNVKSQVARKKMNAEEMPRALFTAFKKHLLSLQDEACRASATARRSITSALRHWFRLCGKENRPWNSDDLSSDQWVKVLTNFQYKYWFLWQLGLANKWTKFHFPALFSLVMKQEVPPNPWNERPGSFLGGVGYCFLRHVRLLGFRGVLPLLKFKKGMPSVHPSLLELGTCDLYKTLGTDHLPRLVPGTNGYSHNREGYTAAPYEARLQILAVQVRRTCHELFENKKCILKHSLPSTSAHWDAGRKKGGALGEVGELFSLLSQSERCRCVPLLKLKNDISSKWTQYGGLIERVGYYSLPDIDDWFLRADMDDSEFEEIEYCTDWVSRTLADLSSRALSMISQEMVGNRVSPQALPEPDKVRMITLGNSLRYWLSRPIQRFTHSVLRNHPTFQLIGTVCTEEIVERVLLPLKKNNKFVSGDYKESTNYLHPDLSVAAVDAVCDFMGWDWDVRKLYREALVNATIGDAQVSQVWGQLMGSPLSFPILCIVNAAINRFFLEMCGREELRLEQCPLLINGDDVVLQCPPEFYDLWKGLVSDAGLSPSVGKNYISSDFLTINSTGYEYKRSCWGEHLFEVPCLNLGLLHPQPGAKWENVNTDLCSLDPATSDLSAISHYLCNGFDYEECDHLMSAFLGDPYVKELLSKVRPGVSFFAAKALGGVGLRRTRDGVLSPEQLGYYTRVAGAHGSLAPTFPDISSYDNSKSFSLTSLVPTKQVWGDWFLENFKPRSGPNSNHFWRAIEKLSRSQPHTSLPDIIQLMGDSGEWGGRAEFIPTIHQDLYKHHVLPWDEYTLCNFPWKKRDVSESSNLIDCIAVLS